MGSSRGCPQHLHPHLLLWPTARQGLVPFYPSRHQPLTLQSTVLRICRSGSLHRAPGAGAGGARCWRPDLVMAFLQKRRQLRPAEHLVTQLPSLLTWDLCSHCDLRPQPKAKIGAAIGRVEDPLQQPKTLRIPARHSSLLTALLGCTVLKWGALRPGSLEALAPCQPPWRLHCSPCRPQQYLREQGAPGLGSGRLAPQGYLAPAGERAHTGGHRGASCGA